MERTAIYVRRSVAPLAQQDARHVVELRRVMMHLGWHPDEPVVIYHLGDEFRMYGIEFRHWNRELDRWLDQEIGI